MATNYNLGKILSDLNCWCIQNNAAIPSMYYNTLSMTEKVSKLFYVVKTVTESQVEVTGDFQELYNFVHDYFDNLDVQTEINNKIDQMTTDGSLIAIMTPQIISATDNYLSVHITNPSNPPLDNTFSLENAAAQSKKVGDCTINRTGNILPLSYDSYLYKITKPIMDSVSSDEGWKDLPLNVNRGILLNLKGTDTDFLQLLIEYGGETSKNIYSRIVNGVDNNSWIRNTTPIDNTFKSDDSAAPAKIVGDNYMHLADLTPSEYDYKLFNIFEPVISSVTTGQGWVDLPNGLTRGIFLNLPGNTSAYVQIFIAYAKNSGLVFYRYNTNTNSDWFPFNLTSKMSNYSVGCLGDSITFGLRGTPWVNELSNKYGFLNAFNYGVSGDTIDKMNDRINEMAPNLNYITIWGGVNDFMWSTHNLEQFKTSFESLIKNIIAAQPEAKLLCLTPMKFKYDVSGETPTESNAWDNPRPDGSVLSDYVNAEIEICEKYAIKVLNMFAMSGFTPDIEEKAAIIYYGNGDLLHPNTEGNLKYIAPLIGNTLINM